MPSAVDTLVRRANYWVDEANLGYDQNLRWDIRDHGTCDCSSLAYWVAWESNLAQRPVDYRSRTLYTGTIARDLVLAGWSRLAPTIMALRPGDYLLSENHHVAICVFGAGWGATLAEANIDERGHTTGGQQGDQNGRETRLVHVYEYSAGWDWILRPPSSAQPQPSGKLDVDGWLGSLSVAEWQRQLGTPADGKVSGQVRDNAPHFRNLLPVSWERSGSQLVVAIQRKVKADTDGIIGPQTIRCIQNFVGVTADSYLGFETACAIQRSLNDGRWS